MHDILFVHVNKGKKEEKKLKEGGEGEGSEIKPDKEPNKKKQGGVFQVFSKHKKCVKTRVGLMYPESSDSVIVVELFPSPVVEEEEIKELIFEIESVGATVKRVHFDN